jgi:hypothetical protein
MRQLVTEVQADGEAARDDPDQLVTAVMACLDGLGQLALGRPGRLRSTSPPQAGERGRTGDRASRGLPARLLPERGQDSGACRAGPAVDERPAAGALEPADLLVEGGLPEAECLGGREDAGVPGRVEVDHAGLLAPGAGHPARVRE